MYMELHLLALFTPTPSHTRLKVLFAPFTLGEPLTASHANGCNRVAYTIYV